MLDISLGQGVAGDVFRVVNFGLGAAVLGVAVFVVAAYAQQYRVQRRAIETGRAESWRGLLPRHVVLIGTSYVLFVLITLFETFERIHDPLTLRSPVYFVAYVTGLWALWDILGHTRHRVYDLAPRDP